MPWAMDLALLLRLSSVYPPQTTTRTLMFSLFAFPVAVKAARLGVLIAFAVLWKRRINDPGDVFVIANKVIKHYPYVKVEWVLQIADNAWVLFS
jgi:hypothetical protein